MRYPLIFFASLYLIIALVSCQQKQHDFLNETTEENDERMEWWREARFGMFIHWGLYAIPAGEWKEETNHAEWIRTTARVPLETYDNFVEEFNPIQYNPKEWVKLAIDAGMKYIVITSKHHDGFCLFDSKYTDFDVMASPYQKDILMQLANECHEAGIKICWYHSIMDWHHSDYLPRRGWEVNRTEDGADMEKYIAYMKNQLKELVKNYGDIGVLWFDGEWEGIWSNERGKDLYNYVRNLQPDIIINNRVDVGRSGMAGMTKGGEYAGDFGTPEQEIPATGLTGVDWETCMTMNNHWGYNKNDTNWKSTEDLIRKLADIASKGGNFLLNVGPTAKGLFPKASIKRLEEIGIWMSVNGEAIYGTQASPFNKLNWGRCTQKKIEQGTRLYFHVFNWPEDGILTVPGIYNQPLQAYLLADAARGRLKVDRMEDALEIHLPEFSPDRINSVVIIDILGTPDISNPPIITRDHDIFVDIISVIIESDRENVEIRFTLDGTMPDINSLLYTEPLTIDKTTPLAARCFRDSKPVSDSSFALIKRVNPLPPVKTDQVVPGLLCNYYEGEWDSLPDFVSLTPMKSLEISNFDLSPRLHDDNYGFMYEGFINIPEDGVYDFYTDSDDGSDLFIDDTLVVENDGLHGMETKKGEVPLSKGLHKIKVKYFEKNGGDDLQIYIKGPGIEKMKVPDSMLYKPKKK